MNGLLMRPRCVRARVVTTDRSRSITVRTRGRAFLLNSLCAYELFTTVIVVAATVRSIRIRRATDSSRFEIGLVVMCFAANSRERNSSPRIVEDRRGRGRWIAEMRETESE